MMRKTQEKKTLDLRYETSASLRQEEKNDTEVSSFLAETTKKRTSR